MWIILALVSAASLAVVHLTDKRLLDSHLPNLSTLYLWIAFGLAVYIVGALAIFGIPTDTALAYVLAAIGSGLALGVGFAMFFVGLKIGEASRAVGVAQTYPIFVALLAVPLLGERLSALQWGAILLVVLGTMVISLPPSTRSWSDLKPSKGTPALLGCGMFLGVGFIAAKLALQESSFPTVFIYQQLGTLVAFLPFCRPTVCRQLLGAMKKPEAVGLLVVGEGLLPLVVVAGALQATNLGPVSLVTAVLATTPLFVFVLATLLSKEGLLVPGRLMEEAVSREALLVKLASIIMIVLGVSALGFF